jgi:N-acetylglucosamine kinase-like BadF-type ATPase
MIIIADGGSTKTNWCLVTDEGKKVYFNTEGYNPYFQTQSTSSNPCMKAYQLTWIRIT